MIKIILLLHPFYFTILIITCTCHKNSACISLDPRILNLCNDYDQKQPVEQLRCKEAGCAYSTDRPFSLQRHINTHKPLEAKICSASKWETGGQSVTELIIAVRTAKTSRSITHVNYIVTSEGSTAHCEHQDCAEFLTVVSRSEAQGKDFVFSSSVSKPPPRSSMLLLYCKYALQTQHCFV
jgi:hypothetical protein